MITVGDSYRPDFYIIPTMVAHNKKISNQATILYGLIYWFSQLEKGTCIASNDTLAKFLNIDSKNIPRLLKQLDDEGYIKRRYADNDKLIRNEIIPLVKFTVNKKTLKVEVPSPQDGSASAPQNGLQKNNNKNKSRGIYTSIKYLDNIPVEDLESFTQSYLCGKSDVLDYAEKIKLWCEAKGKRYKNYKMALRSWLHKDFKKRPTKDYSKI